VRLRLTTKQSLAPGSRPSPFLSSMLRHSNVRTTLGIYSHAVDANKLAAHGQFLNTLLSSEPVQ
jgi:hypothetical protein